LPTCGLSVQESERVRPEAVEHIEAAMAQHGLAGERLAIHMTGCPNGCARPYTPDIGLVGKAKLKYTLYLGGNAEGTRLGFVYDDMVPLEEIGHTLDPLFAFFKMHREHGESFGNFCHRQGLETLKAYAETYAAT
jgi:sulfite reductase (ferredoxin)